MVGSTLSPVALTLGGLDAGLSVVEIGIVLAAATVPVLALLVVGGVVADRVPRQRIMLAADSVRTVSQLGVGLSLLSGHPALPLLIVLQVFNGSASAFFNPASTGVTGHTVERKDLQRANALLSLSRSLSGSLGPLLAATLVVTVGGGWALIADAITYACSAILLAGLRLPPVVRTETRTGFRREVSEGFREVRSRSWVWSSIVVFGIFNLTTSSLLVLGPAMLRGHASGMFSWAGIVAAMSVGEVVGNLVALRVSWDRPLLAARLVEVLQAPLILGVALGAGPVLLVPLGVAAGVGTSVPDALWFATLQRELPDEVISRVSSYDWLGSLVLRPVGLSCAALVGAAVGNGVTLAVGAGLVIVTCLAGAVSPSTRNLRVSETALPATS